MVEMVVSIRVTTSGVEDAFTIAHLQLTTGVEKTKVYGGINTAFMTEKEEARYERNNNKMSNKHRDIMDMLQSY